jgi:hypothetical protein
MVSLNQAAHASVLRDARAPQRVKALRAALAFAVCAWLLFGVVMAAPAADATPLAPSAPNAAPTST